MSFICELSRSRSLSCRNALLPIELIEKFQKFFAVTDQTRNKTGFCLPQNPELIYCWEQLKISIFRGFSTQIQEHLAMAVRLSLGVNHANYLLLSDSKQSLISHCYNLLLSEPEQNGQQTRLRDISTFLFPHYIAVWQTRGKFSKYIGRCEVK